MSRKKSSIRKQLNVLRRKGRHLAKGMKKKPFYFQGKKRPSAKQLKARAAFTRMVRMKSYKGKKYRMTKGEIAYRKHRHVLPEQEQSILTKGFGMSGRKRRRKHKRARSYGFEGFEGRRKRRRSRSRRTYGFEGRRRRHRRYYGGGVKGKPMEMIMQTGLTVAGGFIGSMAARFIPVPAKFKAFVPLAAGIGLTMTPLARKPLIRSLALGMAVIGAISAIKQFIPSVPLLTGDEFTGDEMMGYQEIPQYGEANEFLGAPAVAGDEYSGEEFVGAPAVAGDEMGDNIDG